MDDKVFIYSICCPDSEKIRYIGQTRQGRKRFFEHVTESKSNNLYPVYRWFRKLGKKPLFKILEYCNIEQLDSREIYWINRIGLENLLNIGLGGSCVPITDNHTSKILKGKELKDYYGEKRANEIKSKISNTLKGTGNPNYNGATVTDKWRKNQSVSQSKVYLDLFDLEGNLVSTFLNSKEAAKFLNVSDGYVRTAKINGYRINKKFLIKDSKYFQ